jgi:hypothetical protein
MGRRSFLGPWDLRQPIERQHQQRNIGLFTNISAARLSTGTIYKLWMIGLTTSFVPLGAVFGVFSLFGYDTVTWNGQPVHGFAGLLAGPFVGAFVALMFTALLGSASALGLWVFSKFKPISIAAKGDFEVTSN